jgi:pterin-4a-carbinolamine dehydratase
MNDRISKQQFEEAVGTPEWRALKVGASALVRTGSWERGAELVSRIAAIADSADHHPDIDLRRDAAVVRLSSHDVNGLSERDVRLAREISAVVTELGLETDAARLEELSVTVDALDKAAVMPFWAAMLGYETQGDEDLADKLARWPSFWFQDMDAARPLRNRIHLDVWVPQEIRQRVQDEAKAARGIVATDRFAPSWWTMADAEGNEADIEAWDEFTYELPPGYLSPDQFREAEGVDDWRFLQGVTVHYRTGAGLRSAADLASRVAALADEAGLPAYVDLRYGSATIRLAPPEDGWMNGPYLALAQRIQTAARELGAQADPLAVRDVQLTFDALDIPAVQHFWAAALAYELREETDLFDPLMRGPSIFIQQLDEPREQRNRIHVDVYVPDDQAESRVQAALAAGGRLVTDQFAPFWWTIADPEGNEVDICVTTGREEAWSSAES